jgi:hypothetical protein
LTRVVDIGPTVYRLVNTGGNIVRIADILSEDDGAAIVAVGEVLEILTNSDKWVVGADKTPTMGTGRLLRQVIASFMDDMPSVGGGALDFDSIIGPLKDKLASDKDIEWAKELSDIVKIIQELAPFLSGELNPEDIINQLLAGGLIDTIADSELLSGLVVGMLDGALNGAAPEGVSFNFDGANNGDVIRALGEMTDDMSKLLGAASGEGNFEDFNDIIDMFGGGAEGEETLLALAESGMKIEIDSEKFEDLEDTLNTWAGTLVDDEDLCECSEVPCVCDPEVLNPLRKILGMFKFTEVEADA